MNAENPFNNYPQEIPKQEDAKLEQSVKELSAEEHLLSKEQEEQYEQWMADHPEIVIAPENLRGCEAEIMEFEEILTSFELNHSLAELHLITDLTPEDAPKYPLRESAKAALTPIVAKLNILKNETNIKPEQYEALKAKYTRLSRAVGMIHNNKVDHNR